MTVLEANQQSTYHFNHYLSNWMLVHINYVSQGLVFVHLRQYTSCKITHMTPKDLSLKGTPMDQGIHLKFVSVYKDLSKD